MVTLINSSIAEGIANPNVHVSHAQTVHILQSRDHLTQVLHCYGFCQCLSLHDVIQQLPSSSTGCYGNQITSNTQLNVTYISMTMIKLRPASYASKKVMMCGCSSRWCRSASLRISNLFFVRSLRYLAATASWVFLEIHFCTIPYRPL